MGSQTNRSLAAKNIKARDARIVAGVILANQFDTMVTRRISKSVLRTISAEAHHVPKNCNPVPAEVTEPTWKMYRPSIARPVCTLARIAVDCDGELIKRANRG